VNAVAWVHPEWLAGLAALLGAAALALTLARLRARRKRRRLGPRLRPGIPLARDLALLLALAAIGAALLGPRLGEKQVRVPARGVDVVLLFDVSRSMDARDVAPSRLVRARLAAQELLARLSPGDRVALAFFAGRGVLAAPLTPDRDAIAELVGALDSELLRPAGSNLAAGLATAARAFDAGSDRPRAILLLSDGEDPERRGALGIDEARSAAAPVFAAALGSEAGATVPDRGLPLRDRQGAVVVSRRDVGRLARVAEGSGGALFRADEWGELDTAAIAEALRRGGAADADGMATRTVRAVQVWPCAALAFAMLAAEGLPCLGGRRASRRRAATRLATLALATLLLAGAAGDERPGRAAGGDPPELASALRERPGDPRLLVELGLDRLARGDRVDAMRAFRAAAVGSPDPALAALAWYDLGVAALEQGSLEDARDAFFETLALAPGDRQARFNLEWTQAALDREPPAPQPRLAPPPPDPELETRPEEPRAEPETPEPTDAEQRRRWLRRVDDDLRRALQSAARERRPPRRTGPAW
jgi:Ca-activated chloride channel family protein